MLDNEYMPVSIPFGGRAMVNAAVLVTPDGPLAPARWARPQGRNGHSWNSSLMISELIVTT